MPALTSKIRDTDRYIAAVRASVEQMLQTELPKMYVKFMGGEVTITPLQPIGNSLRFILSFQVTPDDRKKEE